MLGWVGEARSPGATREAVAYALGIIEQRARIARDLARRALGAGGKLIDQGAPLAATPAGADDALGGMGPKGRGKVKLQGNALGARVPSAGDVSQIVTNLVMNALVHAPPDSAVTVTVEATERSVTVEVADQGEGVIQARRDSIFEGDSAREGGAGV